jgi:uncharacterized protein (DUF1499 family)
MEPKEAQERLLNLLKATKRVRIVKSNEGYVHAEFTSRIFRFVDDVEFVLDSESSVLHMRSASRVGYYDFGANRRRIETLTQSLREMGFQ